MTPAQTLRDLLAQPNVEVMPGCYDALSAKLPEILHESIDDLTEQFFIRSPISRQRDRLVERVGQ